MKESSWAIGVALLALGSGLGFAFLRDGGLLTPLGALAAWKLSWLILCFVVIISRQHAGIGAAARDLGLGRPLAYGLACGAACSLPMLLILAAGARMSSGVGGAFLLYAAVATPAAEEVLFRGYLMRQLWHRAGHPAWLALAVSSVLFGLAHVSSAVGSWTNWANVLMVSITGVLFGVLFLLWGESLWVPMGLHAGMNLWNALFMSAGGSSMWLGNVAQLAALLTALILMEASGSQANANAARQSGSRTRG
jgi:membrane protease YdiL (CAAX protease family)